MSTKPQPPAPRSCPARGGVPVPAGVPSAPPMPGTAEHQSAHTALICLAAPHIAVSAEHGQLNGEGMEGFYHAGRRVLARCSLLLGGKEPVPLRARRLSARQARFTATARTMVATGPDPRLVVDRLRSAEGTERITVRNTGRRPVRLPVELRLGTDLAEIAALAVGRSGDGLPAAVHGPGLSWTAGDLRASVTADPPPDTSLARMGLLNWALELAPGGSSTITLATDLARLAPPPGSAPKTGIKPARKTKKGKRSPVLPTSLLAARPPELWRDAHAEGDDGRVAKLFRTALDDVNALLMNDPSSPSDLYPAAGAPWRCALAPAESLRAARMLLPLGTRVAAGTLRTLARAQLTGQGPDSGRLPGAQRHAGPYAPPSCSGTEATLLFPAVLSEARRWGLPEPEVEQLLPAAEQCLTWMLRAAGEDVFVPDPAPDGPYRCEVQANAHRAAVLGAELSDACGSDKGDELRDWAEELRVRFQREFWHEDSSDAAALVTVRTRRGATSAPVGSAVVELLDTGLAEGGRPAAGLLTREQAEKLCRRLERPALDSGWGLRSLGDDDKRCNPFGYRGGAVRVQDSVTAVAALAAGGHQRQAGKLLRDLFDAAGEFGYRLPEMYAAEQRSDGGVPLPHPAACRPAALAAAGTVQLLTTLAGVHPDVPAGAIHFRPLSPAPLGAVRFTGLRVAGRPLSLRVDDSGGTELLHVPDGLRLGIE